MGSIEQFYEKGDLWRAQFPRETQPTVYLGSGRAGGCFDGYGLMNREEKAGQMYHTAYMNACHYHRGQFEMDGWIGLYRIAFQYLPELDGQRYMQHLDLHKGRLTTAYTLQDGTEIKITVFCSLEHRDTLSVIYEYKGSAPQLALIPESDVKGWYGHRYCPKLENTEDGFVAKTNLTSTRVGICVISEYGEIIAEKTDSSEENRTLLTFTGREGRHLLLITSANIQEYSSVVQRMQTDLDKNANLSVWAEKCAASWKDAYGTAYVDIPDEYVSMMTARSIYYVLSSFAPGASSPSAPMGWTGYGWAFHFPHDVSYIHPAMLRLGFIDMAKGIVDYYRQTLEDIKKITARMYGGRGAMWAWEYPIHPGGEMMTSGVPNEFQFEIHNAAYPAKMAYETAMQLGDTDWTEETAKPIVKASAEFFASHLTRDTNGKWNLHVIPSMSQDEYAQRDKRNYLCALYAARYTLRIAVKMGMREYESYVTDGLNFDYLADESQKLYKTSEEMLPENWGKEKHPVQLNPLAVLPVAELDTYEENAYIRRADICEDTKKDYFVGWTLGAFWLATSHMGDGTDLYNELHRSDRADYLAEDKLAFYETTGGSSSPYFITTHGFWLQAVLDAFVCDFSGETKIGAAIPEQWKGAAYYNLHTKDGKVHSGNV